MISKKQIIGTILNDHNFGSSAVARNFLIDLQSLIESPGCSRSEVETLLSDAQSIRPSMVILKNIAVQLRTDLIAGDPDNWRPRLSNTISEIRQKLETAQQRVAEICGTYFEQHKIRSVLTHSNSTLVRAALEYLCQHQMISRVTCTESRPLFEGLSLARSLAGKIQVVIIPDSQFDHALNESDCFLIGADVIDKDLNIINKSGTRMMSLAARDRNRQVICLADSFKFLASGSVRDIHLENHPVSELGHRLPETMTLQNRCFEIVEADLIDVIISEQGFLKPGRVDECKKVP